MIEMRLEKTGRFHALCHRLCRLCARLRRRRGPTSPAKDAATGSRSMVVPRDPRGHFLVEGRVDGRLIHFTVDTCASVIALTARDAARVGVRPPQWDFTAEVKDSEWQHARGASTARYHLGRRSHRERCRCRRAARRNVERQPAGTLVLIAVTALRIQRR
jgi:Aspartyl protease